MEIIRTKRATSAAGAAAQTGQPKSKYRKRSVSTYLPLILSYFLLSSSIVLGIDVADTLFSPHWSGQRATPPGKCHSCNIRETPEWRRGPDGARTLCNACGLHYAKLVRKRDKAIGADGQAARIDMETLRASARASELAGDKSRAQNQTNASTTAASTATTEPETKQAMPLSHHQGSFQVIPIGQTNGSSTGNSQPSHQHHQHHASHHHHQQNISPAHDATLPVPPPPPWTVSTPAGANRNYASDQLQHQSFMRTSHSVSSGASPH
ncbi:GATA-4/5/6 transcription factor [Serpula lacrymans var. lacrymans S7.9]|nr:GATA-4/5/6 transcription factor [Serpula lacrymans var. lacrymans S7.9]EGO25060.1 GATA-4/5/6 transcription factor [Serpula lacrymans var. lacrymans S7.9]